MKKTIVLLILLVSCKKDCSIELFEQSMYLPSSIQILDCKKNEDFLTDGPTELFIVIKLNNEDIPTFIEKNNLVLYNKTEQWLDYFDTNFYSKVLTEGLDIPKKINLNNSYYNFWSDEKASIECILDTERGIFIAKLEF